MCAGRLRSRRSWTARGNETWFFSRLYVSTSVSKFQVRVWGPVAGSLDKSSL